MSAFSAQIARMEDCEAILEFVYVQCQEFGATWFSYNFTPIFEPQTSPKSFIWARDFPYEYQRLYIGKNFRARDPVPRLTFEHGPILTWTQASKLAGETSEGRNYFTKLSEINADNWATFALFGPRNRDGLANVRFVDDPDGFETGTLEAVHSHLEAAHLQICKIIDEQKPGVSLSDREKEVLEWMGRGKSTTDIATILNLSPETVRTYARRVYDKLETNDRVTATVRALKLGLVDL